MTAPTPGYCGECGWKLPDHAVPCSRGHIAQTAPTPGGGRNALEAMLALAARRAETIPNSHRTISKHKTTPTQGT